MPLITCWIHPISHINLFDNKLSLLNILLEHTMDISDKIDSALDVISENRPTDLAGFMMDIKKAPFVEKMVSVVGIHDGMAGLFRGTDGNAYEVVIRPAVYGKVDALKRLTKQ